MKLGNTLRMLIMGTTLAVDSLSAQSWTELLPSIRQKFPLVRQISPSELATWMAATNRPQPLLIDTRAVAEYQVSHLPGAQRAESVRQARALAGSNQRPVVLYCSVGYRSSELATKLIKSGVTNVFNLEGSIFAWANQGRPVVRGAREVKDVHPYDEKWGQLLAAPYRAFSPR